MLKQRALLHRVDAYIRGPRPLRCRKFLRLGSLKCPMDPTINLTGHVCKAIVQKLEVVHSGHLRGQMVPAGSMAKKELLFCREQVRERPRWRGHAQRQR